MEKLILIDGNSLLNRAFYATPAFTNKDGFPTNGIFGFIKLLLKIISDKKPQYLVVAFDLHAPTFRHEMYDEYKAGRKQMPNELAVQIPVLKEILRLMNIRICEKAGYEADDIIGTLAKRFNVQTFIYTGDRDSYQLVDETTTVCFTRKGVSDILELNHQNFYQEIGLTPSQIIDLKALMGDASDHIPGVAGVGEKSARNLIDRFGSLDAIYQNIEQISGALHNKLQTGKEAAYFSYKLATINTDSPIELALSECVVRMPFSYKVRHKFVELDFKILSAMPIFLEEQEDAVDEEHAEPDSEREKEETALKAEEKEPIVAQIFPNDIESVLDILNKHLTEKTFVACEYGKNSFSFCLQGNFGGEDIDNAADYTEYIFPIKENLLDVGFFTPSLKPVFDRLFNGNHRVYVYNYKELRHKILEEGCSFTAPFDDVMLLKYIADGQGTTESLDYLLDYHSLPTNQKSYGIIRLYHIYSKALNEEEYKLYTDIEVPLANVLFDMEIAGVCVDESIIQDFSSRYNAELKTLTKRIYELAGEEFNINSPVKLGKILFEKLGIGKGHAQKSKGKRNYSTSAEVLEQYIDDHEIIGALLRYRQVQKLNSTYIDGFKPLIKKGKIHTTFNQSNTSTGRLSSANPNIQNIPVRTEEGRELRKIFKASPGNVLIDADYSQIELRLLAHFSGCKELIEAYQNHQDIHAATASSVFGVPLESVTPDLRRAAKAVNFGIIYGISSFGLSKDLAISAKQAKIYIDKYFERYSDVKTYMEKNVEYAKENGYIKTLFGRRRVINEIRSSNFNLRSFGERAAMNMPLQGTSADIIKIAMNNVYRQLKEQNLKAKLVLQVHDELIIDCPIEEKETVAKLLKNEMEDAVKLNVPLTVEVGIGNNWFDTH